MASNAVMLLLVKSLQKKRRANIVKLSFYTTKKIVLQAPLVLTFNEKNYYPTREIRKVVEERK